ncbi:MAG: RNA polymerase sigma factor, partial [Rhodococcus sp.]|nr:RNA polymerase sigma factor [Rhodococcus sp. (in: high G+C Gram-positive bacteria)]
MCRYAAGRIRRPLRRKQLWRDAARLRHERAYVAATDIRQTVDSEPGTATPEPAVKAPAAKAPAKKAPAKRAAAKKAPAKKAAAKKTAAPATGDDVDESTPGIEDIDISEGELAAAAN